MRRRRLSCVFKIAPRRGQLPDRPYALRARIEYAYALVRNKPHDFRIWSVYDL